MKTKIGFLLFTLFFASSSFGQEDVTTVEATNSSIGNNLDLEAVATIFGDAEDLEDFEEKLNDPKTQVSNLDLNDDGEVDYLRVIETAKGETHLVTIQAVIGEDEYQDVATIDVEKGSDGSTQAQVVGNVNIYGPNYVITPVYVHPPLLFIWFWSPFYSPWHSPFHWGFYPHIFHPWHPYSYGRYRNNIDVNVNINKNTFNRTTIRKSNTAINLQNKSQRNDFISKHPDKSAVNRKQSTKIKQEVEPRNLKLKEPKARPVQDNWKPSSERNGNASKVKNNRVSVPTKSRQTTNSRNNAFSGAGHGMASRQNAQRGTRSMGRGRARR